MKYYNYILLALSAGILIFLSFFLLGNKDSQPAEDESPKVFALTISVATPDEVEFCDKKVNLDRIDMRERYDRELNAFTYFHSTTLLLIKRANRYFPVIEPILKKNGIPDDFKYLAAIESSLDVRAVSPAKAVGLWQFMPETGKQYGLEIDDQVDERYHIEKSTEAACRYLNEAYRKYGDWVAVAMSYNGGMGRISSELDLQKANQAFDLLLVEETSRYAFRMMAIKEIFSKPYAFGFLLKKENLYNPVRTTNVDVSESQPDLTCFAQKQGISYAQLKEFNPWLRDRRLMITNGKAYIISIPQKEDLYYSTAQKKVHNKAWLKE